MSHDDGWRFLVLGRSIERADMTVRALSLYQVVGDPATSGSALLRSCGAYESFLRTYRGSLDPRHATEFLLLDRLFPRSVYAAVSTAEQRLLELTPVRRLPGRGRRSRACSSSGGRGPTSSSPARRTSRVGLAERLDDIQRACAVVTGAVADRFFRGSAMIEWVARAST